MEIVKFNEKRSIISAYHAKHKDHESAVFMCKMRLADRAVPWRALGGDSRNT